MFERSRMTNGGGLELERSGRVGIVAGVHRQPRMMIPYPPSRQRDISGSRMKAEFVEPSHQRRRKGVQLSQALVPPREIGRRFSIFPIKHIISSPSHNGELAPHP